jgi:hypothetical protein
LLNVVCVLRSGGEYKPEHVGLLEAQVSEHLNLRHRFCCLTDLPIKVRRPWVTAIELKHNWPGWFSKIELFRPGLFDGPVFYIDLDSLVVDNIDALVLGQRFTVLQNFWDPFRIGSALMAWDGDLSEIYEVFSRDPIRFMRRYSTSALLGDQAFIKDHTPIAPKFWQERHPGTVVSYRRHCRLTSGAGAIIPQGAKIICFGGQFRPWSTELGRKIHENFRYASP